MVGGQQRLEAFGGWRREAAVAVADTFGASASARGGGASLWLGGGGLSETPPTQPVAQPGIFGQSAASGISGQSPAAAVATATTQVPIGLTACAQQVAQRRVRQQQSLFSQV
jgi:hypothetical protein